MVGFDNKVYKYKMREDILISADEIENVSGDQMAELEELVEEYQFILEEHEDKLNHILGRINNSDVYKELDVQISVDTEYYYSIEKQEE